MITFKSHFTLLCSDFSRDLDVTTILECDPNFTHSRLNFLCKFPQQNEKWHIFFQLDLNGWWKSASCQFHFAEWRSPCITEVTLSVKWVTRSIACSQDFAHTCPPRCQSRLAETDLFLVTFPSLALKGVPQAVWPRLAAYYWQWWFHVKLPLHFIFNKPNINECLLIATSHSFFAINPSFSTFRLHSSYSVVRSPFAIWLSSMHAPYP